MVAFFLCGALRIPAIYAWLKFRWKITYGIRVILWKRSVSGRGGRGGRGVTTSNPYSNALEILGGDMIGQSVKFSTVKSPVTWPSSAASFPLLVKQDGVSFESNQIELLWCDFVDLCTRWRYKAYCSEPASNIAGCFSFCNYILLPFSLKESHLNFYRAMPIHQAQLVIKTATKMTEQTTLNSLFHCPTCQNHWVLGAAIVSVIVMTGYDVEHDVMTFVLHGATDAWRKHTTKYGEIQCKIANFRIQLEWYYQRAH